VSAAAVMKSRKQVTIVVDGREVLVATDTTVAAALLALGIAALRRSVTGEARAPLCGMGICYECRVTIDGLAHRRACLVPVVQGLRVSTMGEGRP
jgi:D-hydroxyproline dehydrogenase subunit gamma